MIKIVSILTVLVSALGLMPGSGIMSQSDVHFSCTCISMDEGLTSPFVTSIMKDRTGKMWVGTTNGIDSFSFSGHKHYYLDGNMINSIAEGIDGSVWAVTDSSAYVCNKNDDAFRPLPKGICGRCSRLGDEMWVYGGHSLYRFASGKEGQPEKTFFPDNIDIMDVEPMQGDVVLLGTRSDGIWRFDCGTGRMERLSQGVGSTLMRLLNIDDTIFAGYYGGGVQRFSTDGQFLGSVDGISSPYVFDMACHDGNIWIATDGGGVNLYDPAASSLSILKHIPGDPSSFASNAVTVAYSDADGEMWIGTTRYGMYNVRKQYIHTYSDAVLNSSLGLSERSVFGMYRDEDGICWIGTDGNGINSFDPATGKFRHYPATFGDYLPGVTGFKGDDLLAIIYTKGFTLFNKKTGTYRPVRMNGLPEGYDDWRLGWPSACKLKDDAIMILYKNQSFFYDPVNDSAHMLTLEDGTPASGMRFGWHSPQMVLTYHNDGLYVNTFDDYVLHPLITVKSHGNIVSAGFDKAHGRIWVAMDNGIGYCSYGTATRSCGAFNDLESLPFERISNLTVDAGGMVWIAADNRLFLYDVNTGTFNSYGPFDGYARNDILYGWPCEVEDGTFYWNGSSGFVSINTALAGISKNRKLPRMALNEIATESKRYLFEDGKRPCVHIPWKSRSLTLDYSVSGIGFYENARFKFVISGKEESTVTLPSSTLNLASPAPGKYTVSATCLPSNEVDESEPEVVQFIICQPWYRTDAFMIGFLLLLTLLTSVIAYVAIKHYSDKQGLVESAISQKDRKFISSLDEYVKANMDKEISASTLTTALGVSRTALYDKVKMITGYSLNDYIKRMRIEESIRLLNETDMNINEISDSVGFTYPRYFSSVFKELTGYTPTQYRKNKTN